MQFVTIISQWLGMAMRRFSRNTTVFPSRSYFPIFSSIHFSWTERYSRNQHGTYGRSVDGRLQKTFLFASSWSEGNIYSLLSLLKTFTLSWFVYFSLQKVNTGDVSFRKELREKLQCRDFKWYLDNVIPQKFILDERVVAYGRVRGNFL